MLTNMVDIIGTYRTTPKEGTLDFSLAEQVTQSMIAGVATRIGNATESVLQTVVLVSVEMPSVVAMESSML